MTKLEKAQKINESFADGFRIYVKKADGTQLDVSGVCFDGDKIYAFVKKSEGVYERVDVTELDTFKYFLEEICGATNEQTETVETKNM